MMRYHSIRDEYLVPAPSGFTASAEIWSSGTFVEISTVASGRIYKFVIPADGEATRGGRAHDDRFGQCQGPALRKPQNAVDDRNLPRGVPIRGADLRQRAGNPARGGPVPRGPRRSLGRYQHG